MQRYKPRSRFGDHTDSSSKNPLKAELPAKNLPKFEDLPAAHPTRRFNLDASFETRILDLICPLAKGNRATILSPPRSGKTMLLTKLADTIIKNHPEVYTIVLLVMERPEELLDFQDMPGIELLASTFDQPNQHHLKVARQALDKAKLLAASGKDVVILLDSLTRLTRACNILAPSRGKLLSGGLDASALQFPKELFGAARQLKAGGSLTILATCLSETESKLDDAIMAEFIGTGNSEIYLSRELADKKIYPALDIRRSGTRRDELILHPDEKIRVDYLRRTLHQCSIFEAIELLSSRLSKFKTNAEFLINFKMQ